MGELGKGGATSDEDVVRRALELLRREQRVTRATLERHLGLDPESIEQLWSELRTRPGAAPGDDEDTIAWAGSGTDASRGIAQLGGERRLITVVFCDLVDSCALSDRLDPEDLREVIRSYQKAVASVVAPLGGHIAQYLGDGTLIYFGYPRAHEDTPRRAVRAALEIARTVSGLNPRLSAEFHVSLAVRVGVHTGPAVIGEMGSVLHREELALGQTPNIAARLQQLAASGCVVASEATWRFVAGFFDGEPLGSKTLKGISAPLQVYSVLGATHGDTQLETLRGEQLAPFVGRRGELDRLRSAWEEVRGGAARRMLILGDPGIGKSRLLRIFFDDVPRDAVRISCRCSSYHQTTPFYPIVEFLSRAIGFLPEEPPDEKFEKLKRYLARFPSSTPETPRLLAHFLSIPLSVATQREAGAAPLSAVSPQRRKQMTVAALRGLIGDIAQQGPVLFSVEDVHWVDPSSAEFLRGLDAPRVLLLCTSRPVAAPAWTAEGTVATIDLGPLSPAESHALVTAFLGEDAPQELSRQLVAKTDGVPLFIEEQAKAIVDAGPIARAPSAAGPSDAAARFAVAETLLDSLMARLDRLDVDARLVGRVAAVIGRSISYDLLQMLVPVGTAQLHNALAELLAAGLLVQSGRAEHTSYRFRHELMRDVAYESLLKATRKRYHAQCAALLIEHFREVERTQPELIAQHLASASDHRGAVHYFEQAAAVASQRWALEEAVHHLRRALDHANQLADGSERTTASLRLNLALGPPLMSLRGYADPAVEDTYNRVRQLCENDGGRNELFPAIAGLWQYHMVRGNLRQAMELANRLYAISEASDTDTLLLIARRALGTTMFLTGDLAGALEHTETGWRMYDLDAHRSLAATLGNDQGVGHGAYLAWTRWLRGEPDAARAQARDTVKLAQRLAHPLSIAFSNCYAGIVFRLCGDFQSAMQLSAAARRVADDHGLQLWAALSRIVSGWARVAVADPGDGLEEMTRGIAAWQETGARAGMTFFPVILAEAQLAAGKIDKAWTSVIEGKAMIDVNAEHFYEAELLRIRGELLIETGDIEGGLRSLHEAMQLAARQTALSLELRSAFVVARHCRTRLSGDPAAARSHLRSIHDRFLEGHDTHDVSAARAELSS